MAEKKEKAAKKKPLQEIDLDSPECYSNIKEFVSTGVPTLDLAIGRGGVPVGRCTSLVGNPGVGKSSLVYSMLSVVQKRGDIAVLVDSEFSLERVRAQQVGVDINKLILFQGVQLEDFVPLIEEMIKKRNQGDPSRLLYIAYDTISALPSESDLSINADQMPQPGFHSRYFSFAFRRLVEQIAINRVALVLVHQPRTKIATMGYGSTLTWIGKIPTTFYSSVIIQLNRFGDLKVGGNPIGIKVLAKVIRNKIAPPLKSCYFNVLFNSGVDGITPLLEILVIGGKVTKKGGWYTTESGVKFQVNDFKEYYQQNQEQIDQMVQEIIQTIDLDGVDVGGEDE